MMPPLIITAFANPEGNAKLDFLEKEETDIRELFYSSISKYRLSHVPIGHTTSDSIFKAFTKLQARINIFHYGGHANNFGVELLSGQYKLRQFAEILKGSRSIELVFLNGCSTVGLVDTFLNAGVKAVIATDRLVDDKRASKFALNFYEGFLMEGKTLENAFYNATANQAHWEDSKKIKYRDNNFGEIVEDDSHIPWGLYLKKENKKSILNWQLIKQGSSDLDVEIGGMWRQLYEDYNRLKADEAKLVEKLADAIKLKEFAEFKKEGLQEIAKRQQKIDALQKDLESKAEERDLALVALSESSIRTQKDSQSKILCNALQNLNFTKEVTAFKNIYFDIDKVKIDVGAFIIQGSPKCGLFLLKSKMMKTALIPENEREIFIFDFGKRTEPLLPNKASIWSTLKTQVEGGGKDEKENLEEQQQYNLLKKVFEEHLKSKNVILVFKNLDKNSPKQNETLINDFWFTFSKHVRNFKKEQAAKDNNTCLPDRKILAFFIDNLCHMGATNQAVKPLRDYSQSFSEEEEKEHNIFVLSYPEKVKKEGLEQWGANLPIGIDYDVILKDADNYVLPTIKKLCEYTRIINYLEYFPSYQESSENPPL